jgi:hypothetical protein
MNNHPRALDTHGVQPACAEVIRLRNLAIDNFHYSKKADRPFYSNVKWMHSTTLADFRVPIMGRLLPG